jgi:hypothetical protein
MQLIEKEKEKARVLNRQMVQYNLKNVSCSQFHTYKRGISALLEAVQLKNMVGRKSVNKSCAELHISGTS